MSVARRLREPDRRVLREDRELTPEQWRRMAGRWRSAGVLLVVTTLGLIALAAALDVPTALYFSVPSLLFSAFQVGYLKSEDDRLRGRPLMRRRRPDGI